MKNIFIIIIFLLSGCSMFTQYKVISKGSTINGVSFENNNLFCDDKHIQHYIIIQSHLPPFESKKIFLTCDYFNDIKVGDHYRNVKASIYL